MGAVEQLVLLEKFGPVGRVVARPRRGRHENGGAVPIKGARLTSDRVDRLKVASELGARIQRRRVATFSTGGRPAVVVFGAARWGESVRHDGT